MIVIPDCPYCEQPLDGPTVNGLHEHCNNRLQEEFAKEETMLFSGVLNWRDSEGHRGVCSDFRDIEAPDKTAAERVVLDEFWDSRLDSASCIPEIVFAEESFAEEL